MTGDHVREQEGVTMHTNFSQMLLKEHLNASQLQGKLFYSFSRNTSMHRSSKVNCFIASQGTPQCIAAPR
jgi:hypothetical protein